MSLYEDKSQSWTKVVQGVWGESSCAPRICVVTIVFFYHGWQGYGECEKWFEEWDFVHRWLGSDKWNNGGTEGEVQEEAFKSKALKVNLEKTKVCGSEWGRRWSVCK